MTAPARERCRLYLITPPAFDPAAFLPLLRQALDGGDVAALQLRLKGATDDEIRLAAGLLKPVVQDRGVAFIINDRPDLARECGCDGVHVGAADGGYPEARRIVGPDAIVGITCKDSRHLAMEAAEAGADYVAFGAFFPSLSKTETVVADSELLEWWSEIMTVPCAAIGGITPENCPGLVRSGADFLAVIDAVWHHAAGPGEAVRQFNQAIEHA